MNNEMHISNEASIFDDLMDIDKIREKIEANIETLECACYDIKIDDFNNGYTSVGVLKGGEADLLMIVESYEDDNGDGYSQMFDSLKGVKIYTELSDSKDTTLRMIESWLASVIWNMESRKEHDNV